MQKVPANCALRAFLLSMPMLLASVGCADVQYNPYGQPYKESNLIPPRALTGCMPKDLDSPPFLKFGSKPLYPVDHVLSDKTGSAVMIFTVHEDGKVTADGGSTDDSSWFLKHAMLAVTDWQVTPAMLNGKPVTAQCKLTFDYRSS